ncbi:acetamidase [Plectosphaerella plurivora]|uniref:Acetamidase n=1 Tax=Plectosphaerella plurivora TaxID=936078 RepID=A0A9P8V6X5_9PEZI|nr:acetamidase [Plectosphaerella plurivora]
MGSIQATVLDSDAKAQDWATLAATHRQKQYNNIPKDWRLDEAKLKSITGHGGAREGRLRELEAAANSGILSKHELEIAEKTTATELLDKIRDGKLTSEEVIVAFCKMAAIAEQTDSFHMIGKYATTGYTEFLRRAPEGSNGALVNLLLDAGAVFYCKTNVPQTMMTADSENHIFGRTLNPHKTTLTAGGSTGGEGALVGFRGSPLGVGTDIAGSIRIPSLCCGTYGFKPTSNRIPFGGQSHYFNPLPLVHGVEPVAGPLANSVDDLALFMRTVTQRSPWKYDPSASNVGWRNIPSKTGGLTIGVLAEDPTWKLHPPVRSTVEQAVAALEAAGHKIVRLPFDPASSVGLGARLGFQFFSLGGPDADQVEREAGEPLVKSVAKRVHPFSHGGFPVPQQANKFAELSDWNVAFNKYSAAWQKVYCDNGLDVVIGPGAISTSVPHDTYGNPVYTLMWNTLDYPAGIIPFGTSSSAEYPEKQKGTAEFDADYDPEATDGAPCAVQVIAPRYHDEECLAAMKVIDNVLRQS